MNISVVVIAHNEEEWIERCLKSLEHQSRIPDEVVVVLHNCTDRTKSIAEKFSVKIVQCFEEGGPIISRARGIEAAIGEIVCCTDGDCWVDKNWVEKISTPLIKNQKVSVIAGRTIIKNNILYKFASWWQFVISKKLINQNNNRFAWGSNFAFRKKDYEKVGGLIPFLEINKKLKMNYMAEDVYISLALQKVGKIFYALSANVFTYMPPEKTSMSAQKTIVRKQIEDNKKLFSFFNTPNT